MWHYFPRGPLENRVFKTRFIIQNFFKNLQVPSLTGSEQRDSDQREGDQTREREMIRSERERKRSCGSREPRPRDLGRATHATQAAGRATQVRDLGSRDPHDLFLSLSDLIISLSLIWSPSL